MKTKVLGSTLANLYLLIMLNGCTAPDETTAAGALTGGVLGAGLGAIVGNQTGDPASGLAIGAAAGATAGAAVGNAIQAQREAIRTQDEALERQEKVILAQKAELKELRRMRVDGGDSMHAGRLSAEGAGTEPVKRAAMGGEKTGRGSLAWEKAGGKRSELDENSDMKPLSGDCKDGFREALQAKTAADRSQRLFHYRRALRLCPDEPSFHNGIGEVYRSLKRPKDAEFEFREALKYDAEYEPAKKNLATLKK